MYKYPEGTSHSRATVHDLVTMMRHYFDHYPKTPEHNVLQTQAEFIIQCELETRMVPSSKADVLTDQALERANALTQLRWIANLIWLVMSRHALEFSHEVKQAIGYYNSSSAYWKAGFTGGWNGLRIPSRPSNNAESEMYWDWGHACGTAVRVGLQYWDREEHELKPWIRGFCSGYKTPGFGNMNPHSSDEARADWDAGWQMGCELHNERK
jgi:hypothetical protein